MKGTHGPASRAGVRIIQGDCLRSLQALPGCSVQCCVTSPPYWGLRDYGCEGQIGMEATVEEFIGKLVKIFSEVRRVLRHDGVCWVNMGDAYCSTDKWGGGKSGNHGKHTRDAGGGVPSWAVRKKKSAMSGIKPKDLIGQPWMLAFALRADGWYLRRDVVWYKPNAMPESAKDRPTTAHEYLFLLSKKEQYFYDWEAIKEPVSGLSHVRGNGLNPKCAGWADGAGAHRAVEHAKPGGSYKGSVPGRTDGPGQERRSKRPRQNDSFSGAVNGLVEFRNKRSVWSVATEPFPGAHFATFPTKLVTPCILAGTRPGDTVLDPFAGSGTVGKVALELGCSAILMELNADYVRMIEERTAVTPALGLYGTNVTDGTHGGEAESEMAVRELFS